MPGVALPASPQPAAGPALLPQIGNELADIGEKIVAGGLIGVAIGAAIIGGLLGIGSGGSPVTG